jgi:mannose-6-phosphate isomerase-like protein (cupin superfamily)
VLKHFVVAFIAGAVVIGGSLHAQQPAAQGAARGRGAAQPAPPAPAPGSPATYRDANDLMAVLKKNIAATPDMATSAVSNTDQYRVNLVHRGKGAGAIAHPGNTELHYIVEGAATVVTGGTIVRPTGATGGAGTIQGGETRQVKKGDVIIIPAGSAHWYKDVQTPVTYLEVRFVAPAK